MAEKANVDDSIDVAPRVETGEVLKLSKDEQHLANLGYKQGLTNTMVRLLVYSNVD
jgi:hypothetical protein